VAGKATYEIDGAGFGTLAEFHEHFSERVLGGAAWGRNLNAFNDVLRGGFGTPDAGFRLVWLNSGLSRERLGHAETARTLEASLRDATDAGYRRQLAAWIDEARHENGKTVFDWLVEVIRRHGDGGEEAGNGVELELR
jgi:hypothetical protein